MKSAEIFRINSLWYSFQSPIIWIMRIMCSDSVMVIMNNGPADRRRRYAVI